MNLSLPPFFVNERVSLNLKMEAYEKKTLAELEGSGCITHIWLCPGRERMTSRNTILRIFFDEEETPFVEAPVGDFFGVMHGENFYPINTEYLSVMEETGYNCYFKMPFSNGARIELETGSMAVPIYLMVDWHRYPNKDMKEEYRFCARWRHENPTERYGKDFLMLDADGPGRLIGFVYGVRLHDNTDRWSHGGAENIYIDGEEKYPAYIRGIGGEDTFGTSYGGALHHPETMLYASMPYYIHEDIGEARPAQRLTGYRFYVKDRIEFQKSIQMRFGCMKNEICSTVYWYSKQKVREFYRMPPADSMFPDTRTAGKDLPLPDSGEWSICGPFPISSELDFEKFVKNSENLDTAKEIPLNSEYTYGPDNRKSARWSVYKANHGFVDFRHDMRVRKRGVSPTEDGCGIAVCQLYASHAVNAILRFAWDDELTIYLNGERIYLGNHKTFREGEVQRILKEGRNDLYVCLSNTIGFNHGGWCFAFSAITETGERIYPRMML